MEQKEKLKLNEAFALAIGWKRRGRKWVDPLGNEQLLPPPYFKNDALAWGGMARNKALSYQVGFSTEMGDHHASVWNDERVSTFRDKSLATAICAAVAMFHGRWRPEEVDNANP